MPPKKRQRIAKDNKPATTSSSSAQVAAANDESSPAAVLNKIDSVVGNLLAQLDNADSPLDVEKLKDEFLELKGIQNDLFAKLRETETAAKERQAMLDKRQKQLQALRYEERHLESEIEKCQSYKTPYLEKIVADEQAESLDQFLKADMADPTQKPKIVLKLQMEINARGTLQRDLKNKQQKLAALQDEVKKKKAFLQSLPSHVASMERASIPLQKAMYNSDSKTKGLRMNGTSRRLRLDAAQSLPLPLFTLFSSLQNYLDQAICQQVEAQALSLAVTGNSGEKQKVLLHVPIADPNHHGRLKNVTLHFQYMEESDVLTATVSSSVNAVFQETVLERLFPSDALSKKEGQVPNVYSWCDYLAGLHRVEKNVNQHSVRAIVRVLCRRLRANATLKTILTSLQRHQIPALPEDALIDGTVVDHTCKLSQFVGKPDREEESGMNSSFKVVLRKDSEQLAAQVELHKSCYPEIPPRWKLNLSEDGQPPLYDERLAEIEQKVNVEMLEIMKETAEVSHEWILVHQLHRIMEAWDS